MIIHITEATVVPPFGLDLLFDDGTRKFVDVEPLLEGPVFELLRDPEYFATVQIDEVAGTVTWENGADIAPDTLYRLPNVKEFSTARAS